jgi:hypothetical protein
MILFRIGDSHPPIVNGYYFYCYCDLAPFSLALSLKVLVLV